MSQADRLARQQRSHRKNRTGIAMNETSEKKTYNNLKQLANTAPRIPSIDRSSAKTDQVDTRKDCHRGRRGQSKRYQRKHTLK